MKNTILRRPNPGAGQGSMQAISSHTGWEYEHDETDAQINALEDLIAKVRAESGASTENHGCDEFGGCLRGATFSWSSSTDDGEGVIRIATSYTKPGTGIVVHRGVALAGTVWATDTWEIDPDGTVREVSS